MSECFVDLLYRGLTLGSRVRLTDAMANGGFLELAAPMPVGTTMTLSTDDGVSFEVTVMEVREHGTAGMVVRPVVSTAAEAWWGSHVGAVEAALPVDVVRPKRRDDEESQLVDDGRTTVVMEAAQPELDNPGSAGVRPSAGISKGHSTPVEGVRSWIDNPATGRSRRRKRKR